MSPQLKRRVVAVCTCLGMMGVGATALGQNVDAPVPAPAPAPTEAPPPPPPASQADAPPESAPAGQWVFTNQYGWVFMPYAQSYTYVPDTGYPFMFVYGSTWGWRWLSAPWVLGLGPRPYWGPYGFTRFAWHARPWFAPHAHYAAAPHMGMHGFGRGVDGHHRR